MVERKSYQDVNIPLGDDVSKLLYEASTLTHINRPGLVCESHESFSGFRSISLNQFNDVNNLEMNLAFDGVGTKVEVSERLDDHSVVAKDLFAMVCDDAVVRGAEPIAIGTILDIHQLDDTEHTRNSVRQLAEGYVEAARQAKILVVNGEVAELGERVGGYGTFNYNWGAAVLWLAHKNRILTGDQIRPDDALIGLAEHGFRSNGITDVRNVLHENYGENWHNKIVRELGEISLGRLVQQPSVIYSGFMSELTGGYDIAKEPLAKVTGVAHITGGGQPSKLGRMLEPSGLGAEITDPPQPPKIMLNVQELSGFDDKTAYGKWHMGAGMIISTPEPDKTLETAENLGFEAKEIGKITDKPGIRIRNMGVRQDSTWLDFATSL